MFGLFRYKGLFDNATSGMFGLATLKNDPNCVLIQDPSVLTSMYIDRAGTTLVSGAGDVVGKMLDLSGAGNHSVAPSDAARPVLKIDANGKYYLERDIVDDNLPVTWPTNLTTEGVIYTAAGDYTTKDSGLTLSGATNYTTPKYSYGLIVMASESKYDAKIIKYLDAKRGRAYQLGPELVTNGGFDSADGWTTQTISGTTYTSITGGKAQIVSDGAGVYLRTTASILSASKIYLCSLDVTNTTAYGIKTIRDNSTEIVPRVLNGRVQFLLDGCSGLFSLYRLGGGSTNATVDNVSVREILL
jgi:hypothetical protein